MSNDVIISKQRLLLWKIVNISMNGFTMFIYLLIDNLEQCDLLILVVTFVPYD